MSDVSTQNDLKFGRFEVRPATRELLVDGQCAKLGARAFDVLMELVGHRDRVISKNELMDRVWPGLVVEENNLYVHIVALRKILGASVIATIPGRGYRFVAADAPPLPGAQPVPGVVPHGTDSSLQLRKPPPNNLPQHVSAFVGRVRELSAIRALLATTRLLTVAGVGGLGKTRIALELAASVLDDYPDGVWFVDLAPIVDLPALLQAVARTLGVREEAGRALEITLAAHARSRRMLVVLDNCEHLLDASAHLATELLRAAKDLRMLVTTREPLRVDGEQLYPLGVMSLPEAGASVEEIGRSDAVRLFTDRCRSQAPSFTLSAENARTVGDICTHLDGIPLALELAAARMDALDVGTIAERLKDRFELLNRGRRLALPRQQTLRTMVDWSYDLLGDEEKRVFALLSVFAGGWTLSAAESVIASDTATPADVADRLAGLVDKSMVVVENGGARYRMLETIHEYARERFAEDADAVAVRARHRDWCITLAKRGDAIASSGGGNYSSWIDELDPEQENLRAALNFSLADPDGADAAMQLCASLERFWAMRAQSREGRQWCDAATAHPGANRSSTVYARAVLAAGLFASRVGQHQAARASAEEALDIATRLGDSALQTLASIRLGNYAMYLHDYVDARAAWEKGLALCREGGDRRRECFILQNMVILAMNLGDQAAAAETAVRALALSQSLQDRPLEASILVLIGGQAWYRGDLLQARALCEQGLAIFRAVGARAAEADPLRLLAEVAAEGGDTDEAIVLYLDSLAASREHGDPSYLDEIAILAMALSKPEDAARFAGAADALREAFGLSVWPAERDRFEGYRARCVSALGSGSYDEAYGQGRVLSPSEVVAMTRAWLQAAQQSDLGHTRSTARAAT